MTTIITRLYADRKAARAVRKKLLKQKFREADVDLIAAKEGDDAARIEAALERAMAHESAAKAYARPIAEGGAALVVRADYRPLGARRIAREILADSGAVDAGGAVEDRDVKLPPKPAYETLFPKVLKDHPLFFRIDSDPGSGREPQTFSELTGIPPLTNWRPGGQRLTERPGPILPFKTIDDRPRKKSVLEDHPRFSERFGVATIKHR
ncbi:hypothetical protein DLJ49_12910 [Rhodovulum sp. 12E13]|uniref:hypothetical protein n=1 Tax=Rhodovulum sp. 12E13 TaxID=2203891 RepID=UPI000E1A6DB5|nr:hypothetical protein [Rhodovulum sp. 12E13]RDC71755.1 hypothetical protein DLJ49_12910 [Rhodovulum sp. 12E13]